MKREVITISDSGAVTVPREVRMTIGEIADLFGIYYQTTKRTIRALEKSRIAEGDYSMSCVVAAKNVSPEYYGLEMVIAVAFRVQSRDAKVFRNWAIRKILRADISQTILLPVQNGMLN